MCEYTPVADFYNGQSILITGGTGFLGKVVIEKLLYSCPGINKIYILIREKRNTDVHQRLQDILKLQMFNRLKNLRPEALKNIIPIIGDISEPNLGLSNVDENTIRNNVSLMFHIAANVRFNEPLEVAININFMGTCRALELFRSLKNRKAFVYVSTAYTNIDRKVIDEIVHPAPATIEEIKTLLERGISDDEVKELIKHKVNTYIYTKSMAESFIAQNHGDLPVTIVRPSVISSSNSEPIPGWVDTWMGASSLMTTIAKGFNKVIYGKPENIIDFIPVDYVSNLIIVAAAKGIKPKEATIFHGSSCEVNPLSLKEFINLTTDYSVKNKFNDMPMPGVIFTTNKWILTLLIILLQVIPAYIADLLLFLVGKKTRFAKLQTKVNLVRRTVDFYTIRAWKISAKNAGVLAQTLSPSDRKTFSFDALDINWKNYIPLYLHGVRTFLLNENNK